MGRTSNKRNNGEDDGSLAFLNLPTPKGQKKSFHCAITTQQRLQGRTFWIIDFATGVKTRYGEGKYVVLIKFEKDDSDDMAQKFFTGSSEIQVKLDMIRERNAFPRKVTLHKEGNNYWIE